jgi:hypothetical protein
MAITCGNKIEDEYLAAKSESTFYGEVPVRC